MWLFLHAGCLFNIYWRILSFLEDKVSDVTSSFSKKRKLMRISLSRSPKIIEARLPLFPLLSSRSARQKKLCSSQSGCTEPTRRDRKSSSRRGVLAGGQLTSQERTDRGPAYTHTRERARCLRIYHTCNDPVNLNLRRSCPRGSRRGFWLSFRNCSPKCH